MEISALQTRGALERASAKSPGDVEKEFERKLNGLTSQKDRKKEIEDAAAGLVSQALILPMLRQVRRSSMMADGPFSPGKAEKAFGPEFDMRLADRIARSPQMGVTKALIERLTTRTAPAKALDIHG